MDRKTFGILAISALFVALAVPLLAQTFRLTANVPFEFVVADKTLPAGEYSINLGTSPSFLIVQGTTEHVAALAITNKKEVKGADPAAATKLVFNRYGDKYFLSEVLDGYASSGRQLSKCRAERELAKTASISSPEKVVILAMR